MRVNRLAGILFPIRDLGRYFALICGSMGVNAFIFALIVFHRRLGGSTWTPTPMIDLSVTFSVVQMSVVSVFVLFRVWKLQNGSKSLDGNNT